MSEYNPGIYVKNGTERVARTAADAVALVFQGYKLVRVESAPVEQPEEQRTAQPEAVEPGKALEVPTPRPPRRSDNDKD